MSNVVLKRCKQFGCKLTVTGNFGRPVGHVYPQTMRVGRINQLGNGLLQQVSNFVGLATNNVVANGFEENTLDWRTRLGQQEDPF